jgi:hypothetical protein
MVVLDYHAMPPMFIITVWIFRCVILGYLSHVVRDFWRETHGPQ